MNLRDVQDALERWSDEGRRVAVATLVSVRRSAPLPPGARFVVSEDGELAGSISSGCVEGDLHERLTALFEGAEPDLVTYGISDEMAADVGLSCGGEIDVFIDLHDPSDPAWARLVEKVREDAPAVLLTALEGPLSSRRMLLEPDGRVGSLGSAQLDERAIAMADELFARTDARKLELVEGEPSSAVFAESFVPPPRLAIVGATPIGEALCAMAARVGFEVVVIDPREAFAREDRFPEAVTVMEAWPDEALAEVGLDPRTSVVVLTHDAKIDEPALATAIEGGCGYIGLLGGRRTQTLRREALIERGFAAEAVEDIHGPVGLSIDARTPPEIAVSILAELIAEGRAP